ncbi:MAG: SAM-dependent MidA family methyltransferase [Woeseiaceae bacterium]|jgi:SAM-dependent MidA family methyltransferase
MQPKANQKALELPQPGAESARHSAKVAAHIRSLIEDAGGHISFAEFMQHALYAPGLGYYVAGTEKFGAAGDFVTAPEISPLFGRILANQCASVLQQIRDGQIFELGAGSGALAVAVLERLNELQVLPQCYFILEVSADLKERQQQRLRKELPELAGRVQWLSEIPANFSGVIIANEVVDALPVERFQKNNNEFWQERVALRNGEFSRHYEKAPANLENELLEIEDQLGQPFADGYESELSPGAKAWVADLASALDSGCMFLFDYGVTRREYYAADRSRGWLRCHFRHHAHDNALLYPGIQDLTSWVDFTLLADSATQASVGVAGFVTQAHFLMNGGLENELAGFTDLSIERQVDLSRQVKLLTLPTEMGENFKCLGLSTTGIETPPAFAASDRRHAL